MNENSLAQSIDAQLPQTQCTKCGYQGCRPYAEAIATDGASINRCPPGGAAGIAKLAHLLHQPIVALDPECGEHQPFQRAFIEEELCIGCTLCIQVCPVDAIIGAPKQMHTVWAGRCTGCDLCIAPCPVDCIVMVSAGRDWTADDASAAREHHRIHLQRVQRLAIVAQERREESEKRRRIAKAEPSNDEAQARKTMMIRQAIERARTLRNQTETSNKPL